MTVALRTALNQIETEESSSARVRVSQLCQTIAKKFEALKLCLQEKWRFAALQLVDPSFLNIDALDADENTPLFAIASTKNCATLFARVVSKYPEVNCLHHVNLHGQTVLHQAAKIGDFSTIRFLVGRGVSLFTQDDEGRTPFGFLAQDLASWLRTVSFCKDKGVNIVWAACASKYLALKPEEREMLQQIEDVEAQFLAQFSEFSNDLKIECFEQVLGDGDLTLADKLVDRLPLSTVLANRTTPIHLAAYYNTKEILEKLTQGMDQVDLLDENGRTPLHYACMSQSLDSIEILVQKRANCYRLDQFNVSPLNRAVEQCNTAVLQKMYALSPNLDFEAFLIPYSNLPLLKREEINAILPLEKVMRVKMAAHIWGIEGTFKLEKILADFEGFASRLTLPLFFTEAIEFFRVSSVPEVFRSVQHSLEEILDHYHQPIDLQVEAVFQGKWAVVPMDCEEHARFLFFRSPLVYWCDRSQSPSPNSIGYTIGKKDKDVLEDVIQSIYELEGSAVVAKGVKKALQLTPSYEVQHKPQSTHNCCVAGLKAGLHALLFQTALEKGKTVDEARQLAKTTYKTFSKWIRLRFLDIDTLPEEFLEDVQDKIRSKSFFSQEEREQLLKQIDSRISF